MSTGYKLTPASAQKRFPLLMPTLDGLTKYAHLIDVEYFADLLQVSKTTQLFKPSLTVAVTVANVVGVMSWLHRLTRKSNSCRDICGILDTGLQLAPEGYLANA